MVCKMRPWCNRTRGSIFMQLIALELQLKKGYKSLLQDMHRVRTFVTWVYWV